MLAENGMGKVEENYFIWKDTKNYLYGGHLVLLISQSMVNMEGARKSSHSPQDGVQIHKTIDCSSPHRVKGTFSSYIDNNNTYHNYI